MAPDMENVTFARENEQFAENLYSDSEFEDRTNWIVTIRFYSLLHFVEERLQSYGYNSRSHDKRKENILNCKHIDDKIRKRYRFLEDLSRDARYECIRMDADDVKQSKEKLQQAKNILGFHTGNGSNTKYST